MGANFTGITFDDCNVSPSDDGLINRTILPDGILSGCEISYSGSTLTMASGTLIACGRQFRHPAAQNWAVVDATTGYARLLITLDLTRSATDQAFDQVVDAVEYANDISGFSALVQQDLNAAGTKYQVVACVVSLGTGGISGIINTMPTVHPASADGGTLTVTAPGGSTVTVSKDGKTLTRVAWDDGIVVFRGLQSGTWTLSITDGAQTASKTVEITADYAETISFFTAEIVIRYWPGFGCSASVGGEPVSAPDDSGIWHLTVTNPGTVTVSATYGEDTITKDVDVTAKDTYNLSMCYLYDYGKEVSAVTGGWGGYAWKLIPSGSGAVPRITKNADNIYIQSPDYSGGVVRTANKVNLDGFNYLRMTGEIYMGGTGATTYYGFAAWESLDNTWRDAAALINPPSNTEKFTNPDLPVDALTGAYYVGFGTYDYNQTKNAYIRMYSLLAE